MNKKSRFKVISCILSVCMILSSVSFAFCSVSAAEASDDYTFSIIHTNDFHGTATASESYPNAIGYARIATLKALLKNEGKDPILVDSGDNIQGTPFASMSQGSNIVALMNKVGYDVTTLGNHEFEFGTETLLETYSQATFRAIAANVINNVTNEPFLKGVGANQADNNGCNYIIERNGHKIGFFGIDTTETKVKTNPNNVKTVDFNDEIETAEEQVKILQDQGAEMIVAVVHTGWKEETTSPSAKLAKSVSGIDLILDGHSHEVYNLVYQNPEGKDVIVMQEGIGGECVGQIDVTFNADGTKTLSSHTLAMKANEAKKREALPEECTPDQEVTDLYNELNEPTLEWENTVIGESDGTLIGRSYSSSECQEMGKAFETNLGDLAADADVWAMNNTVNSITEYQQYANLPMVSIENGGGMRAGAGGLITNGELYTIFPFPNALNAIVITPKYLYDALECGVSKPQLFNDTENNQNVLNEIDGGFPQIGGMAFEWDVTGTARTSGQAFSGDRVKTIWLLDENGNKTTALDKNDDTTQILLSCNEYLASGGNDYETLAGLDKVITLSGTDDGLSGQYGALRSYVEYLQSEANGSLLKFPAQEGRITLMNTDTLFPTYTAEFDLSYDGTSLANTEIDVTVDGALGIQTLTTDASGILKVENLSAGNHELMLTYTNSDGDVITAQTISDNTVVDMLRAYKLDFAKLGYSAVKVDNIISQLPATVTQADANQVSVARKSYDKLTTAEKAKVTNYQKLLDAEAAIAGGGTDGWKQLSSGQWQYFVNGAAVTGWCSNAKGWEGQWFYFDADGIMQTGWLSQGTSYYFLNQNGTMARGWKQDVPGWEGKWFNFSESGAMLTGWNFLNWSQGTNWFDFQSNGVMYVNTTTPDGFNVDANGAWVA